MNVATAKGVISSVDPSEARNNPMFSSLHHIGDHETELLPSPAPHESIDTSITSLCVCVFFAELIPNLNTDMFDD